MSRDILTDGSMCVLSFSRKIRGLCVGAVLTASSVALAGCFSFGGGVSLAPAGGIATVDPSSESKEIIALVEDYETYRTNLKSLAENPIVTASDVKRAKQQLIFKDHEKMAQSFFAYTAALAAEDAGFAHDIGRGTSSKGKDSFLRSLDSTKVWNVPGARTASSRVVAVVQDDASQMKAMAANFKQVSYDLQKSKKAQPPANQVKFGTGVAFLNEGATASSYPKGATTNVNRKAMGDMLTLGAHLSAKATKGRHQERASSLVRNKEGAQCLKWAKLNLAQCLAASRDASEEAYCLSRHGLDEVADCWSTLTTG